MEPILQRRGQVESHDFVGCIMEFAVNGRPLEPSQALAAQGILDQYVCYIWDQMDLFAIKEAVMNAIPFRH